MKKMGDEVTTSIINNDSVQTTSFEGFEDKQTAWPIYIHVIFGILISIMILSALVGNLMTVIAYWKDSRLQITYNVYILNLATADFFIGLISLPFYAVYTLMEWTWPFGRVFCKVFLTTDFTMCTQSVVLMVLISLDRLLLLKHGIDYVNRETKGKAWIKVTVAWLLSFCLYGPAIIGWDMWVGRTSVEDLECDVEFAGNFSMTLVGAIAEFAMPLILMVCLNFLVYWEIRKITRGKVGETIGDDVSQTPHTHVYGCSLIPTPTTQNQITNRAISTIFDASHENSECINDNNNSRAVRRKGRNRDIKAAKYLACLVLVFVICWAPYTIATVMISFCNNCVGDGLYEFLTYLLWLKSSINPIMYAMNNDKFRNNFKRMLRFR